jgi:acyl-CoA thioester hydrolase
MGHMNVACYVAKFDEATWQLLNAIGLTPSRIRDERIGMAGVEQHIEYKSELFPGDVVTVTSRIVEARERVVRFVHEMRKDDTGELAATMALVAVHMDMTTRRARALPLDVRDRAAALIETNPE